MARSGDALAIPRLGVRVEFIQTAEETSGELVEFDLVGRPRGFITLPHMHPSHSERHEVIEGSFVMRIGESERVLSPGESVLTPAGTPHRHRRQGEGLSRVRVQLRPAAPFEAWLNRIAAIDREGRMLPGGWPRPVAAAQLLLDSRMRLAEPRHRRGSNGPPLKQ